MEEAVQEKPFALLSSIGRYLKPKNHAHGEDGGYNVSSGNDLGFTASYTVTIRKGITAFDDALAAANGLKVGHQQILNLTGADDATKRKIVDFIAGVNYAQDGTWEEIGKDIYLIVPKEGYVEVAPASPRMVSLRN